MNKKKRGQKQKEQKRIAPLTPRQKQTMIAVLIRDGAAFAAASNRLVPAEFSEYDRIYAIIWASVQRHFAQHGNVPDCKWLDCDIESFLERSAEELTESEMTQLNEFLDFAFNFEISHDDIKVARSYLALFLKERLFDKVRSEMSANDATPENMDQMFSNLAQKVSSIESLRGTPVSSPFSKNNWRPKPIDKISTLCPFLDEFLKGGDAVGEVYGIMGPYGSCKTTLAVQLSASRARYHHDLYRENLKSNPNAKAGVTYYFFYESDIDEFVARGIAHIAQIDIDTMREGHEFSTEGNLKPYEKALFASKLANNARVMGEAERSEIGRQILNTNWRLVNMTGNDPEHPGRGAGLVEEIRDIVQSDLESNPHIFCAGIYIDYVGAAAKRHAAMVDGSRDELRHYIGEFPLQAENMLAGKFRCPVYLFHQLAAAKNGNKKGVADHTDAAEGKNFGENCNFCFQIGRLDLENRAIFTCTKARRAPLKQDTVIQVDGQLATVRSTDGKYILDPMTKSIVSASERKKVIRPEDLKRPRPAGDTQSELGRF